MRFLRIRQVVQLTGLSRMTICRLEIAGQFPRHRQLNSNSLGWLETDIAAWAKTRPVVPRMGICGSPLVPAAQ
jgi:prophage regulatory protein